jgi:hypothetical protein
MGFSISVLFGKKFVLVDFCFSYSRIEWVKIFGDKYVKNMVLLYQQLIFPQFLIIHDILILPNMDVVFCWSLGNGRVSRVIGRGSRVIGRGSKVEVEGQKSRSRVKSRGSKFKGRKWEILFFY